MKRLIFLSLAVFLCLPEAVYATSIGGPETQGKNKLGLGFDTAYVFNRDLSFKKSDNLPSTWQITDAEANKGYEETFKISYGLLEWLDVYARLGVTIYGAKANVYLSGVNALSDKIGVQPAFAWGFGVKGSYPVANNWLVGCDLQYFRSNHDAKETEYLTSGGGSVSTTYKSTLVQEWQVAPFIAYKIGSFVPYLGARYSDARINLKSPADAGWTDNNKYAAKYNAGVFLGTDYKIGNHWKLNLEGRFVDETAFSAGATYRF